MTTWEVLRNYPNININYTKTNIPVLPELPADYRWADEVEVEYWWHIEGAIQVNRGVSDHNGPMTSIAVPKDGAVIDLGEYHS